MKFILKHVIVISAVFLALTGCDKKDIIIGDDFIIHSGVVLDSADLQPVDSVLITIGDTLSGPPIHGTDSLGRFSYTFLFESNPISFMKNGFLTTVFRGDTASRFDSLTILLVRK